MKHDLSGSLALLAGTCLPFWIIGMATGLTGEKIGMFEKSAFWTVPLLAAFVVGVPLVSFLERWNGNWLRRLKNAARTLKTPHLALIGMGAAAGTLAAAVTWGTALLASAADMLLTIAMLLIFVVFMATYCGTLAAIAKILEGRHTRIDGE